MRTPTCVVSGWAALRLSGAGYFDGLAPDGVTELPVPLIEGDGRLDPYHAISVSREAIDIADIALHHGIRTAIPERALVDEMRRVGELRAAVRAADVTFAAELTSIQRTRKYAGSRPRRPRMGLVRQALELASEHVRSPMEPAFRLIWVLDAGWPTPLCNRSVLDADGRLIGIPDLLDVEHGIVGEYDGAVHRTRARHRKDVAREADFRRVGLEYFGAVGADLNVPSVVIGRMEASKSRARLVPWTWQLGPEGESLDQRLEHRDRLRRIDDRP